MKTSVVPLLCATLISSAIRASAQTSQPPPRDDNQSWNEVQLIAPIHKKADFMWIGVLRVGRNFDRPVDERIGGAVAFKPNKYLTLAPTYLYVAQQPFAGSKVIEHRLVANITGRFQLGKFTFTNRNLIERHVRHFSRDFTVYRNRLRIDYPVKIGSFAFKPFVADEVFYGASPGAQRGWTRNRIGGGIIRQMGEKSNFEIFYVRQTDGRARPGNVHAIGTLFRIYP
ncbi:MAG: DUF2490 domain-containing protein [Blastocatellia bacterium]